MEQILEFINPILAALIVAGTEGLKRLIPSLSGQLATIIVAAVFSGVWFLFDDGLTIIEGIISLLTAIATYDFVVKPLGKSNPKNPPTGGGGLPPKP